MKKTLAIFLCVMLLLPQGGLKVFAQDNDSIDDNVVSMGESSLNDEMDSFATENTIGAEKVDSIDNNQNKEEKDNLTESQLNANVENYKTKNTGTKSLKVGDHTISPEMSKNEVDSIIKSTNDILKVQPGTYAFSINFNHPKTIELLGDVVVKDTLTFKDCVVEGNNYLLTAETSRTGQDNGLNVEGKKVTLNNVSLKVRNHCFNYSTKIESETFIMNNSTLDSSNNKSASGMFIRPNTKKIITNNSHLIMCNNGLESKGSRSGIWSDMDGSNDIVFDMTGGSLILDNNGLNGFNGGPGRFFGKSPRPTFNLHNVIVSASGNGKLQTNGQGDGFSYAYINLVSDTGKHTFNVNNNAGNGVDGGRNNNCALNAKNYIINANNNGKYGIHISKDTSKIENSNMTANNNGLSGLYSRIALNIKNSKIKANGNQQNGIEIVGNSTDVVNSDIVANNNSLSGVSANTKLVIDADSFMHLEGNTIDNSGYGAFYVHNGEAKIAKGADVCITKNHKSGIYVNGSLDIQSGKIYENGDKEKNGGGVQNHGTFIMGNDVRIHNNQASEKGDDVYNVKGASLSLIDEPKSFGLILNEDQHAIDGWYYDGKGDVDTNKDNVRWDAFATTLDADLYYNQEKENLKRNDEVALKAANGLIKYAVTINFLEDGTNTVLGESVITDTMREGTEYDVSQFANTKFEGYTLVRTDGDAYTGILDKNKEINLYYKKDKFNVSYEFVSGTKNMELPDEVMNLLPHDETKYEYRATVHSVKPNQIEVKVSDGTWKFVSYNKDSQVINGNIEFIRTWEFEKKANVVIEPGNNGGDNQNHNIHTGDTNHLGLWITVFAVSVGLGALIYSNKKTKNKEC